MTRTLLFTSFTTWKPEQPSNASDDLLLSLMQQEIPPNWHFLRQIPVAFDLAATAAIAHIQTLQPDCVICCGMAEKRTTLQLERQAMQDHAWTQAQPAPDPATSHPSGVWRRVLHTPTNLDCLSAGLLWTEISDDAGPFVCNHLYFSVLDHFRQRRATTQAVFVHVPVLTAENSAGILADFRAIADRLAQP